MAPLLALIVGVSLGAQRPAEAGAIVRQATAAVQGDSVAAVMARWSTRLRRDSSDGLVTLGLSTLARLTYDYPRAEKLYARLLAAPPQASALEPLRAQAQMGLALSYRARGLQARADSAFVLAADEADRAKDVPLEAEALVWLGVVRVRTRGFAAASEMLREAKRLIPPGVPRLAALLHCARAETYVLASRPGARAEAVAGAALAQQADDPRIRASCLHLIAADLHRRDKLDSALAYYSAAVAERRRVRDRAGLAATLQWRGYTYYSVGAFGDARRDLEEAVREGTASGSLAPLAWALGNLATLSNDMGDVEAAAEYASRAESLFQVQGDQYGAYLLLTVRAALATAAGSFADAERIHRQSLRLAETGGFAEGILSAHVRLAHLAMRAADWVGAERELKMAREAARRYNLPGYAAGLRYHEGALALRRGRVHEAIRVLAHALATLPPSEENNRHYYATRLAEAYARLGDLGRAETVLRRGTDALESWRARLDDRHLRLLAFQASLDDSDPDLGFATVVAALAAGGRTAAALELAERRRGRELLDDLIRAQAIGAGESSSASDLPSRRPAAGGLTASEIPAALPNDSTALLEFVTGAGNEPTTAFLVSRAGLAAYELATEDSLGPLITRFTLLLESGADPAALARSLGTALLDSLLARLRPDITRLVVIPDGPLHRLPFDALRMADGRYVVERFAVSEVPSAALALRLWRRPRRTDAGGILVFADPEFSSVQPGGAASAEAYRTAFTQAGGLPRLAASAREARAVAQYSADATVLERGNASEAALRQHPLRPYRVIHFATHAIVDQRSLGRSALALAPGGGEDGFVVPSDLARLDLDADLVVLSACRTAGGVVVQGEGVQGLTAPLLGAGARSVVATTWLVGDRSVVPLVDGFYRALATGLVVGDALRRTKLEALRRGVPAREWAAFTVLGDPLVRVPLHLKPSHAGSEWWLAAGVALAVALAYGWMRKRSANERV